MLSGEAIEGVSDAQHELLHLGAAGGGIPRPASRVPGVFARVVVAGAARSGIEGAALDPPVTSGADPLYGPSSRADEDRLRDAQLHRPEV